MIPIATGRCPSCGVLNPLGQPICNRCLGPLPAQRADDAAQPMTGETIHLYHSTARSAMLLFSRTTIEYTAAAVSFTTGWDNVSAITHQGSGAALWLFQTPHQIKLPLSSSRTWFSDITRTIPLEPFGYPNNPGLYQDLGLFAPQLRRHLRAPAEA
jgi:hypothetical protein